MRPTEENAEVVAAIADAVDRHDLETLMVHLDDEIEHRDLRLDRVGRGREAIRAHFVELWNESPSASFTVDELVTEGEWVVARQTWHGLAEGELVTWVAREFRNRKVRRIVVCAARAEALEAAGL
jgi:predicted ester cyclase